MNRVDYLADDQLYLLPDFLPMHQADLLLAELQARVDWQQPVIRLFGKQHPIPRLQAFQGETGIHYRYSGRVFMAEPWHPAVRRLLPTLEQETGHQFNCALLNLYRDGQDCMGWHSDDEPELGPQPVIASLSLGQTRRFLLRHKTSGEKLELQLGHGDLLMMGNQLQQRWQHSLPRTRKPMAARVNLTFRQIHL